MLRRALLSILVPATLLLVAVAAPAVVQAGGGCHGPSTPPGDGQGSVIKIDGCMFYPTVARVPTGTTVRFVNGGQVPHNVTGVSGEWGSPGEFAPGADYRVTFSAAGIYPFACTLHPGMNGAVVVGEAAAAAAPAAPAAAAAPAAPAAVTAGSEPTAAPAEPAAPAQTGLDWPPTAIAGLTGFGLGVIGALLVTGALGAGRRSKDRLITSREQI